MKLMVHQLCHHNLDFTLLSHVSLTYVQSTVAIDVHLDLFTSSHTEYHCYSPPIKMVYLYCAVFQQSLRCMPTISLVCVKQLNSYL